MNLRAFWLTLGLALLFAAQVAPGLGVGDALAGTYPQTAPSGCTGTSIVTCPTREMAYTICMYKAGQYSDSHSAANSACQYVQNSPPYYICFGDHIGGVSCGGSGTSGFRWTTECPSGATWNGSTNTCWSAAVCLAKPALPASKYVGAAAPARACSEGCQFGAPSDANGNALALALGNDDGTWTTYFTGWKPTGEACASGDPPPVAFSSSSQDCVPAGAGQTFCVKSTGDHCYTASTGKQICWRPGEIGEKTSDAVLQVRNAGATPAAPQTVPPSGSTLQGTGSPVTKTTVYAGTTITTTVKNYTTSTGAAAGGPGATDSGQSADGTGSVGDTGDKGSASGGETCASPPACSGDAVGCAVLAQQYAARCEAAGRFDIGDADTDEVGSAPGDSAGLWGSDPAPALDESGILSSRTCPTPPTFTVAGQTRTIDTSALCNLGAVVAALVLLVAFAQAAWIMGEH